MKNLLGVERKMPMENHKKINEMIHNMEQIIVGKREVIELLQRPRLVFWKPWEKNRIP